MSWLSYGAQLNMWGTAPGVLYPEDQIAPVDYQLNHYPAMVWDNGVEMGVLWPSTKMLGSGGFYNWESQWERRDVWTGVNKRKIITGTVLNASSNPVSGAQVYLVNTGSGPTSGTQVDHQVSDAAGNYIVGDPNNVTNYVLAVSGATQGVTVGTLTGS